MTTEAESPAPTSLRVALCQINTWVGDLAGNQQRILEAYRVAEESGADVALFPELAITGYPPEDLLLKAAFLQDSLRSLNELAGQIRGHCAAVVGWVEGHRPQNEAHDPTDGPWNAAAVIHDGAVVES
ncbi:MAG: hypothetical protein KDB13_11515, partial [Microthrixaceae bacterium]|nr:hypothetical protein [Microthrixaceae bacterium]MCB0953322.1 hypothetical protein [Microthrixaceae bacterium]